MEARLKALLFCFLNVDAKKAPSIY